MFSMFQRQTIRQQVGLPNFTGVAQAIIGWLAAPTRRASAKSLQVLESVALTPHASLALVRIESDTLVLGVTAHGVTVLTKGKSVDDAVSGLEPR